MEGGEAGRGRGRRRAGSGGERGSHPAQPRPTVRPAVERGGRAGVGAGGVVAAVGGGGAENRVRRGQTLQPAAVLLFRAKLLHIIQNTE